VTPQLIPAHPELIFRLSFTHLAELIQIPDHTQRRFYEIECIRGNWSVRELRRQITSLYYERSGLSKDKAKLSAMAHAKAFLSSTTVPSSAMSWWNSRLPRSPTNTSVNSTTTWPTTRNTK
jgi:hypothetical protein